ncbi:MAG TPA: hypothetical protein VNS63_02745 [Blastocatellia bacterium]|nr:hypothetical protein [Blastocatellia bacterium]
MAKVAELLSIIASTLFEKLPTTETAIQNPKSAEIAVTFFIILVPSFEKPAAKGERTAQLASIKSLSVTKLKQPSFGWLGIGHALVG